MHVTPYNSKILDILDIYYLNKQTIMGVKYQFKVLKSFQVFQTFN